MNITWFQRLGPLVGLGLLLSGGSVAAAPAPEQEMHRSTRTQEFERIEQPPGVRLGVTAVGVGLIGLELWWFLGYKPKSRSVRPTRLPQTR